MAARYFPRSDSQLLVWLGNFQSVLPAKGEALGLSDAEVTASLDEAKALAASITNDEQKYAEWQAATAHTKGQKRKSLPVLQRIIDRMRTAPDFTEEHDKALMAVPPSREKTLSRAAAKPALRGFFAGGKVRIHYTRGRFDGINVYGRRQGENEWSFLARDTRPPYDDPRPPVGAEIREYRAFYVSHDEEVGQPSDIVTVTAV
jgi:hypothetical protein